MSNESDIEVLYRLFYRAASHRLVYLMTTLAVVSIVAADLLEVIAIGLLLYALPLLFVCSTFLASIVYRLRDW